MEDLSTFLELPLHRDLYLPKSKFRAKKPPLKVLITEANTKIAWHLMYKICMGEVFGPDQEIILHLVYSRGKRDSRSITSEFYLCGFPLLLDIVTNSDPEKIYKNVDLVVTINPFEELSGYPNYTSFFYQVLLTTHVAMNMVKYAKNNSKLVLCGPSTKGSIVLLSILIRSNLKLQYENVSGVTILDETIAKSLIAAKLKTTTTQIKNVVIWGATRADIRNGTVFTYPSEDLGRYRKVHIPLAEALQDDKWIQSDLLKAIHKRINLPHFVSCGIAVAAATATHLKLLFQGSKFQEEILSMGVLVPPERPYGLDPLIGFSLPVTIENGCITIRENVPAEVHTLLMNMKDEYNLTYGKLKIALKALKRIPLNSTNYKRDFKFLEKVYPELIRSQQVKLQHILCTNPNYTNEQNEDGNSIKWDCGQTKDPNSSTNIKSNLLIKFKL